jgi:hypothetical protein
VASSTVPWWTKPAQLNSYVDRAGFFGQRADRRLVEHVEPTIFTPAVPAIACSFPSSRSVAQTIAPSRAKARAGRRADAPAPPP